MTRWHLLWGGGHSLDSQWLGTVHVRVDTWAADLYICWQWSDCMQTPAQQSQALHWAGFAQPATAFGLSMQHDMITSVKHLQNPLTECHHLLHNRITYLLILLLLLFTHMFVFTSLHRQFCNIQKQDVLVATILLKL